MIYKNLIFIHIPRTGGTSIEKSIGLKLGSAGKHDTGSEIRKKLGEKKWSNSFVFSFVRNPWDRIISLYHQPYFRRKPEFANADLAYFIQNYKPADWEKKFYFEYLNTYGIDFIGRFESRTEDLKTISQITGAKFDPEIHERKTNRNPDYRSYYNDQTMQMVYDMYEEDIKKYKYIF